MKTKGKATEYDVQIGAIIRKRRKELKITQEALADIMGVSFQQLQKYERGENCIKLNAAGKLARALKLHISDLHPDWEKPQRPSYITEKVVTILEDLGQDAQKAALDFAKTLRRLAPSKKKGGSHE